MSLESGTYGPWEYVAAGPPLPWRVYVLRIAIRHLSRASNRDAVSFWNLRLRTQHPGDNIRKSLFEFPLSVKSAHLTLHRMAKLTRRQHTISRHALPKNGSCVCWTGL